MALHPFPNDEDAHWMTAKRDDNCSECKESIYEGDRIVYSPKEYKAYCAACGEEIVGYPDSRK